MIDQQTEYQVRLSNFEGPLDLLLYLIKKEEIDIYDIPIATITKQYLEYIEVMQELDLEVAGEFILMAATLIRIKVRMLLPRNVEEGEEEEEDPREVLIHQLLEYKRYKEVAESLMEMEDHQRRLFPRSYFDWQEAYRTKEIILKEVSLFDLITAFKFALEHMPKETFHEVGAIGPTLEDQMAFLSNLLKEKERVTFTEIVDQLKERITVVVTFVAILELIRTHRIVVRQMSVFGDIWIIRR
jgi:segregation and condensation protein A